MLVSPSDLKEYAPIPWGWLKMLAGAINALLLSGVAFVIGFWIFHLGQDLVEKSFGVLVAGLFASAILGFFLSGAHRDWIRSYFARNVRGYFARFWLEKREEREELHCEIVIDASSLLSSELQGLPLYNRMIAVRLGGWYNGIKPALSRFGLVAAKEPFLHWTMRLHPSEQNAAIVEIELRYRSDNKVSECLILRPEEVIRVFGLVEQEHNGVVSLADAFKWYVLRKDELQEKIQGLESENEQLKRTYKDYSTDLAELSKKYEELAKQASIRDQEFGDLYRKADTLALERGNFEILFGRAINSLREIESLIEKTDRLKTTIEGRELLVDVLDRLQLFLVQANDPEHDAVAQRLLAARQALEEARKRSRRGGSKPEPSVIGTILDKLADRGP